MGLELIGAIAAFLRAVPELIAIYRNVEKAVGRARLSEFLGKLDESTALMAKAQDPSLPMDEKRKIRREALERSANLWGGIAG